jgi:hypothetical protein
MVVLRDFTPCSKVCSNVSEERTALVFKEDSLVQHPPETDSVTPKMEAVRFSETSAEDFPTRFINSQKMPPF